MIFDGVGEPGSPNEPRFCACWGKVQPARDLLSDSFSGGIGLLPAPRKPAPPVPARYTNSATALGKAVARITSSKRRLCSNTMARLSHLSDGPHGGS